jgi:demethylmenaquinone methyltransferase/2-methoxy-6-polyprenyl-1,4-benzoquinol methylase
MDTPAGTSIDAVLTEQIAYYRARAGEYDQWFNRQGRYDRGPDANAAWFAEADQVAGALADFGPRGEVLEIACGTGIWTRKLLPFVDHLTALDSAPEVLAINRAQVPEPGKVEFVQANLFTWQPRQRYDVVFFSFWLSHVPPERFTAFWDLVRACLKPGGRVFFVDSQDADAATYTNYSPADREGALTTRRLNDGREYRIVKVFHEPAVLQQTLADLGWAITVRSTPTFFLYGSGAATSR